MQDFEKLGVFYLGRRYDPARAATTAEPLLYDSRDLTTHAVCVGMTGSGKTGLCVSLLEEAALDGVPAIAVDPKGDIGNLLLTFPELAPADFAPWIDADEAARQGQEPEAYAKTVAARWRRGLADWGQDGARIAALREAVDLAIYTPGSSAGLGLSLLRALDAPPPVLRADAEALRERVQASVAGLLSLLGMEADPVRSPAHILLSTLIETAWREGRDLDLPELIREIQSPPFDRLGFMDLESVFPSRERFALAMRINNLLASPGFASWLEGDALDVQRLLWTEQGRPRISILSISHLSDAERMFFVTVLLGEVVAWMRAQPGTASLRALLYMDEVFGFLPPVSSPPSKEPFLTLLKQARAYGVGCVLATQNPVDLDYKALSNAGTWFLGRLQTERDKARVLDGLESSSAGGSLDRSQADALLSGLDKRVFLMNNVHESGPVLFQTRWAMSYLRGPLTRAQVQSLMGGRREAAGHGPATGMPAPAAGGRPVLAPEIEERFLAATLPLPAGSRLVYRPALYGSARLHFADGRRGLEHWEEIHLLAMPPDWQAGDPWHAPLARSSAAPALSSDGAPAVDFDELPPAAAAPASYERWRQDLAGHLYREERLVLWHAPVVKQRSEAGESEDGFRSRVSQAVREERDRRVAKLEKRYARRLQAARDRVQRAGERIEREQEQYGQKKIDTAIAIGSTVLGALFGRRVASRANVGRAATAARKASRAAGERADIARAEEALAAERDKLAAIEEQLRQEVDAIRAELDPASFELESVTVKPRKADLKPAPVTLVWTPWRVSGAGIAEPLFR